MAIDIQKYINEHPEIRVKIEHMKRKARGIYEFFQNDFNVVSLDVGQIFKTGNLKVKKRVGSIPPFERAMLCFCLMGRVELDGTYLNDSPAAEFILLDVGELDVEYYGGDAAAIRDAVRRMKQPGTSEFANKVFSFLKLKTEKASQEDLAEVMTFHYFVKETQKGGWNNSSGSSGREMHF